MYGTKSEMKEDHENNAYGDIVSPHLRFSTDREGKEDSPMILVEDSPMFHQIEDLENRLKNDEERINGITNSGNIISKNEPRVN
jgi:hypothetical protein